MSGRQIISDLIALTIFPAFAQSGPESSSPTFEVASVRPSKAAGRTGSVQFPAGRSKIDRDEYAVERPHPDRVETDRPADFRLRIFAFRRIRHKFSDSY